MRSKHVLSLLAGAAAFALAGTASAQFQVRTVDGGDPEINNIDEAESVLASAPTAGTDNPDVINYSGEADTGLIGGDAPFPGGLGGTDDFALEAVGVVDIIGGTTGTFSLGVNSDDGFRLRRNGTVVQEFTGDRDDPDAGTTLSAITLSDGDVLRLTYYERGGGDNVEFLVDADNNLATLGDTFLVGSAASGIDIVPIPEPASLGLLALGGLGLLAGRRR